jgi:hypothetical protein
LIGSSGQVFVDASGRRRRLVTVIGAVLGSLLAVGIAVLVAGMVGAVPLPLPGLPASGQGIQDGQHGPAAEPTRADPSASPTGTGRTPAPTSRGVPTAATTPPVGSAPTGDASATTRGNRPSVHPGNSNSKSSRPR